MNDPRLFVNGCNHDSLDGIHLFPGDIQVSHRLQGHSAVVDTQPDSPSGLQRFIWYHNQKLFFSFKSKLSPPGSNAIHGKTRIKGKDQGIQVALVLIQ